MFVGRWPYLSDPQTFHYFYSIYRKVLTIKSVQLARHAVRRWNGGKRRQFLSFQHFAKSVSLYGKVSLCLRKINVITFFLLVVYYLFNANVKVQLSCVVCPATFKGRLWWGNIFKKGKRCWKSSSDSPILFFFLGGGGCWFCPVWSS